MTQRKPKRQRATQAEGKPTATGGEVAAPSRHIFDKDTGDTSADIQANLRGEVPRPQPVGQAKRTPDGRQCREEAE